MLVRENLPAAKSPTTAAPAGGPLWLQMDRFRVGGFPVGIRPSQNLRSEARAPETPPSDHGTRRVRLDLGLPSRPLPLAPATSPPQLAFRSLPSRGPNSCRPEAGNSIDHALQVTGGSSLTQTQKRTHNQADGSADRDILEPEDSGWPLLRQQNAKQHHGKNGKANLSTH